MPSKFRITIDRELEPYINVHLNAGTTIIFNQYGVGLFYFDTTNKFIDKDKTTEYKLINTIDSNNSFFHRK